MNYLKGNAIKPYKMTKGIAESDHKISFVLSYVKNKKVLDLGCVHHNPKNCDSKYWLHKAIKNHSKYVIGLDLYEEGVTALKEKGYNVIVGDAEEFQLDEKFDVIVAGDIIEHLSNPGKMIECATLHIKSGGVIIISTPNPWYWKFLIKTALLGSAYPNPEHTAWFCKNTLKVMLKRYGWRIREIKFGSRFLVDKIMPLPNTLKHTSLHICAEMV